MPIRDRHRPLPALVRSRASHGTRTGPFLYHASEITSVTISRPGGLTVPDRPDRLDVRTAQYLPDDPGEPAGRPRSRSRCTPAAATG